MTGYYAVRKRGDEPELLTTSWDECLKVTKGLNRCHRRFDAREEATKSLGFSSDKQALSHSKQTPSKRETARPSKKSKKEKATLDLNSSGRDSSNDDGTPPPTSSEPHAMTPLDLRLFGIFIKYFFKSFLHSNSVISLHS
jgi:hypothetical protein